MDYLPIRNLGLTEHLQRMVYLQIKDGLVPTRIIEVNKNSYVVADGINETYAELSGALLNVNFRLSHTAKPH